MNLLKRLFCFYHKWVEDYVTTSDPVHIGPTTFYQVYRTFKCVNCGTTEEKRTIGVLR